MHDIDRALFEAETEAYGETYGESYGETSGEGEYQPSGPGVLGQSREHALAAELLEVTSEAEMDHFLRKMLSGATSAVRDFARSDTGQAVGGVLKSAAKQVLPQLGQIAGDALHPGGTAGAIGRWAGDQLASRLELGLQTEGLSAEDREYETARAFVRFAHETAQRAAETVGTAPPAVAAQQAATAAAQQHLPGLLSTPGAAGPRPGAPAAGAAEGRWIRRGHRIVVIGA